ncbi:MAG: caspase family protein [Leptolyngbyaceae cyanobacterium]
MTLGRRDFLQRLSVALAALGVTDGWLAGCSEAYQQALADPHRCLAMLVGINDYPANTWQSPPTMDRGPFLEGALTDVELQRELLTSRFGVNSRDIVTLVNQDATVNQILETIQGHLVDLAKPGDTVVFHFSGLGSQAQIVSQPDSVYLPTLVAADSRLSGDEAPVIQDLFEESICQLLSNLKGVKVLTVIDASVTSSPVMRRGNFRVRSRPTAPIGDWQAPFDPRLSEPTQAWESLSRNWPGILLQAQTAETLSFEGNWTDFSAGLFTYALTQQIWTSLPNRRQRWFIHHIDRKLGHWTGSEQSSKLLGRQINQRQGLPLLSGRLPQPAAQGVVKSVDAKTKSVLIWLGGLSPTLLPYCELGLQLQPLPGLPGLATVPETPLTVKSVAGLQAQATVSSTENLSVGTPVIETERRLPKEVTLTVALDPDLERIERVDATSALAGMSYIDTIARGEHAVDCLFGQSRSTLEGNILLGNSISISSGEKPSVIANFDSPPLGYGLFTPDGALISGTAAESEEAVKTAVSRLTGTLERLLSVKMLRLTTNSISSRLPVRLLLETQQPKSPRLLLEETLRARQLSGTEASQADQLSYSRLARDHAEQYQMRLVNAGAQRLYYLLVSLVERTRLAVYCPPLNLTEGGEKTGQAIASESVLGSDTTLRFPQLADTSFAIQPLQDTEVFAIVLTQPFSSTWKAIRTPEFRHQSDRWSTVPKPLAMTQALYTDIDRASAALRDAPNSLSDNVLSFNTNAWATLSL